MVEIDQLKLVFADNSSVICPEIIMKSSTLFVDMIYFTKCGSDPIQLPFFITNTIISDIKNILEEDDCDYVKTKDCAYIVEIIKTLDFLLIEKMNLSLKTLVNEKLTVSKSFQVFQNAAGISCLENLRKKCAEMILKAIEIFYVRDQNSSNVFDPFIAKYSTMVIQDIQNIIFLCPKSCTRAKILMFNNWWQLNSNIKWKEETFQILSTIDTDAAYIPRQDIKFMRVLREAFTYTNKLKGLKVAKEYQRFTEMMFDRLDGQ